MLSVIYIILAGFMYYAFQMTPSSIALGGINIMFLYLFGIAIILLAAGYFLVRPEVARFWLLAKYSTALSVPYFISVFISLNIWVINLSEPNVMVRGTFYSVYQILAVLTAAATLYIFGSEGIYLNLTALILANGYVMIRTMRTGGAAEFFRQFLTLLQSGATETGDLMLVMEIVGLVYSFGMYILYILFCGKKKSLWPWLFLPVSVFFFLVGFKRSATIGLFFGILCGLVAKMAGKRGKRAWGMAVGGFLTIAGMAYIWLVRSGTLDVLISMFGVNTSGRDIVYDNLMDYYTFDPGFLGTGLGYITKSLQTGELFLGIGVTDVHNDFLRQYVEQGFWGYLVWLISMFIWRIYYFSKRNAMLGTMALINSVFCFCCYFTENIYFLFYANTCMALLMMSYAFEEMVEKERTESAWL